MSKRDLPWGLTEIIGKDKIFEELWFLHKKEITLKNRNGFPKATLADKPGLEVNESFIVLNDN